MYLHCCDITFTEVITIWTGPNAFLMFAQFLNANVSPLHVSYCRSFVGARYIYIFVVDLLKQ